MAWTLCTKADVMTLFPIPEGDLKDFFSETVEGLIRQHLGAPHLGQTISVTAELHDGDGTNVLTIRHPPVVSVSELTIQDRILLPDEYTVTRSGVELRYITFPQGALNVAITYISGSAVGEAMDPVIRLTAVAMIVAMLNYKGRAGADTSIKWGNIETKEGNPTPNIQVGLTSHLTTILKRLLRRDKVRIF